VTNEAASALEKDFALTFPAAYRNAVTDAYPFSRPTEELDTEATALRTSNRECRQTAPWGFLWKPHYWRIGGDGAGGFYFIDSQNDDSTVYFCDHEDMPASIEDLEHIDVTPFPEFIENVRQLEKDVEKREQDLKERVANRKWWELWVPRQWPPKRTSQQDREVDQISDTASPADTGSADRQTSNPRVLEDDPWGLDPGVTPKSLGGALFQAIGRLFRSK
jgi:hypothetical protein